MKSKIKIFMDFDGTISKDDVGEAVFREFADPEKINRIIDDLLNDRISAKESWIQLCKAVDKIDKQKFDEFINTMEVEPTVYDFIKFCSTEGIDIYVLSDGFDYYIDRILKKKNISGLKVYSNHLQIIEGQLIPSFPYYDENCFSSANCKRNHILNHSSDDDFTVFIGDGNSDKGSVEYCDFVFAKDGLLRFCEMERITFFPFRNFTDIIIKLKELNSKKRLKKRHQAQIKRQQAYTIE